MNCFSCCITSGEQMQWLTNDERRKKIQFRIGKKSNKERSNFATRMTENMRSYANYDGVAN